MRSCGRRMEEIEEEGGGDARKGRDRDEEEKEEGDGGMGNIGRRKGE